MSEPEYEVEKILKAKIIKKGKYRGWKFFVKWKGYDDSDNTWEPADSFQGSAEEAVSKFWERARPEGRDINDITKFKHGEEFMPVGPPVRRRKSQANDAAPRGSSSDKTQAEPAAPADVSPTSTRSKGKRPRPSTDVPDPVPKKRGRTAIASERADQDDDASNSLNGSHLVASENMKQDTQHSVSSVPDSEDEIMLVGPGGPQASPSAKQQGAPHSPASPDNENSSPQAPSMPAHRVRAANPLIMRTDDAELERSLEGAISAKARPLAKGLRPSGSKPGPGKSSKGFNDKSSSLLTFKNGSLATLPRTRNRTISDKEGEILVNTEHLNTHGAPIDDSTSTAISEPAAQKDVPAAPAPTLLELAGVKDTDMDALADYDEEPTAGDGSAVNRSDGLNEQTPKPATPPSSVKPLQAMSNIFSAVWGHSTIFGPFGLASSNGRPAAAPTSTDKSETTSGPYLVGLDPTITVPVTFKDISASSASGLPLLDAAIKAGPKGPPGKLYRHNAALSLLETLVTGGSFARMVAHESASEEQRAFFSKLRAQLDDDGLFIFMAGSETLACCSSTSKTLCQKLGIAPAMQGLSETVMVSHVRIADHCAFADAAMEAEPIRWQ